MMSSKRFSEVDVSKLANPYNFSRPVTDARLFVGREDELTDVFYYLRQAQETKRPTHIAFIGDRASGKTSFLNITGQEARAKGFCVVRVDLDEGDTTTQLAFFRKFFHQVSSQAFSHGAFGGKKSKTYQAYLDLISTYRTNAQPEFQPLTFASIIARALDAGRDDIAIPDDILTEDLELIASEVNKPIIVLMDECNVFKNNRIILEKLRNLFMNITDYMLVFSGTKDLFPIMDDIFSPITRQFKKIEIGPFRHLVQIDSCVRAPLSACGMPFSQIRKLVSPSILQEIFVLSSGKPYEVQLICHHLFRQCQSKDAKKFELTVNSIERIQREIAGGQDLGRRPIIQACKTLRRRTLEALGILSLSGEQLRFDDYASIEFTFHGNSRFSRDDLRIEYDHLLEADILQESGRAITFQGDSFDLLYIKYIARQRGVDEFSGQYDIENVFSNKIYRALLQFRDFTLASNVNVVASDHEESMQNIDYNLGLLNLRPVETYDREQINDKAGDRSLPYVVEVLLLDSLINNVCDTDGFIIQIRVKCRLTEIIKFFYWKDAARVSNLNKLKARFDEISARAAAFDWEIVFTTLSCTIPSRQRSVDILTTLGDDLLRERVGSHLLGTLPKTYIDLQNNDAAREIVETFFSITHSRSTPDANNAGYLYLANGNLEEAKLWLDAAVQRDDDNDRTILYYNRGCYYALIGELSSARFELDRAEELIENKEATAGVLLSLQAQDNGDIVASELFGSPKLTEAIFIAREAIHEAEMIKTREI